MPYNPLNNNLDPFSLVKSVIIKCHSKLVWIVETPDLDGFSKNCSLFLSISKKIITTILIAIIPTLIPISNKIINFHSILIKKVKNFLSSKLISRINCSNYWSKRENLLTKLANPILDRLPLEIKIHQALKLHLIELWVDSLVPMAGS